MGGLQRGCYETFSINCAMEPIEVEEDKPISTPLIHQSIPSTDPKDYLTVTQRYYTPLYHLDPDREKREDLLILCHSNKICLVALAPSHPILKDNLVIDKVNLDVSKNIDRKSNKTSGKSKKGGQALQDDSILVILETETKKYKVKAIVPGKLICINKVITEDSHKKNMLRELEKKKRELIIRILLNNCDIDVSSME